MTCYIYLARAVDVPKLHKIGLSKCPISRVLGIQDETGHPMMILYTVKLKNRGAAMIAEKKIKLALKHMRSTTTEKTAPTEWFSICESIALDAIRNECDAEVEAFPPHIHLPRFTRQQHQRAPNAL
ncbi:Bacteriophage T5, Orf172 DNA-binding [uncultured Caudovirales phage]|uniref:Bacteriophage T5, Orf172 DNA-binding n=1 Tax=uncultured Caudovirales phage TaxID=2100421 RepID=A0A6J5S305_9CAUD|nr:Bacteriophage T5, Orf172 DNA-binding [uncultured Caudovirales phage]CAB4220698.1 Bacteriophage T5, Orf172 DNA-binding [uncultured Caudovirales phage]